MVEYITGIENVSADKKVLIEKNTGTWCGYCSDGAAVLDDLVSQFGNNLIPVVVHDGDEMEFNDSLRTSFSINSYPGALVDRYRNIYSGFYYSHEARGRGFWDNQISDQINKFTPVNVSINGSWDATTREIVANVNLDYVDNSAGDARIVLMIVEDSLSGTGSGWDQANNYDNIPGHPYYLAGSPIIGFIHKHVLRDYAEGGCFGVDNVIPHFVSSGTNYQHTFNYTLPTDYDANQITLVAAVVKYADGNDAGYVGIRGQKSVYNAEAVYLKDFSLLSAVNDVLQNDKKLIKIVDLLGRESKVLKNQPFFYIYDDGTVEKKIIIE